MVESNFCAVDLQGGGSEILGVRGPVRCDGASARTRGHCYRRATDRTGPLVVIAAFVLAFVVAVTVKVDWYGAVAGAPVKVTVGAIFTLLIIDRGNPADVLAKLLLSPL